MNRVLVRKMINRIAATGLALYMVGNSVVSAFGSEIKTTDDFGTSVEAVTAISETSIRGEAVFGVTSLGRQMLTRVLKPTDIVLSDLMDVSGAVNRLSRDEGENFSGTSVGRDNCSIVLAQSGTLDTEALISLISKCYGVLFVERNTVVEPQTIDYGSFEWFLDNSGEAFEGTAGIDINLDEEEPSEDGQRTVIAILDSGIDYTHRDLKGRMINLKGDIHRETGCGKYGYDATNTEDHSSPMDEFGHGTHVAGTVSSVMGDKVSLCAVKVLDSTGIGSTVSVVSGLKWILAAKTEYGIDIAAVNRSLGNGNVSDLAEKLAIMELDEAGITTIVASGNEGNNLDFSESSALSRADSTIIVDALNADGTRGSYSNYGLSTDLYAPGSGIMSTVPSSRRPNWFSYAAYETGNTLLYTSFESEQEDTLVLKVKEGKAQISEHHHMTGENSLQIDGTDGAVDLELIPNIDISVDDLPDEELFFGMAFQDYGDNYVIISLPVKNENGEDGRLVPFAIYRGNECDVPWTKIKEYAYDSFAETMESMLPTADDEAETSQNVTVGGVLTCLYSEDMKSITQWAGDHNYSIDWDNFRIGIHAGSAQSVVSQSGIDDETVFDKSLYLDCIGIGWGADHYDIMTGTSMATPVVTGVYGLVYNKYGDVECNDKLSARVLGSASHLDISWSEDCITGGIVDAKAALEEDESKFSPVLQISTVSGDMLILKGWFLGEEQGSLTVNGTDIEIMDYSPDRGNEIGVIIAALPTDIDSERVIEYTNTTGRTGRIYADVSSDRTDFDSIELPQPMGEMFIGVPLARMVQGGEQPALYVCYEDLTSRIFEYDQVGKKWAEQYDIDNIPGNEEFLVSTEIYFLDGCYYAFPSLMFSETGLAQQFFRLEQTDDGHYRWKEVGEQLADRVGAVAVISDDILYIVGGTRYDESSHHDVLMAQINQDGEIMMREAFTSRKIKLGMNARAVAVEGQIYLTDFGEPMKLLCINPQRKKVKQYDIPVTQKGDVNEYGLTTFAEGLYLVGNFDGDGADILTFDTETVTWREETPVLDSSLSKVLSAVCCENRIYILGKSRKDDLWFIRSQTEAGVQELKEDDTVDSPELLTEENTIDEPEPVIEDNVVDEPEPVIEDNVVDKLELVTEENTTDEHEPVTEENIVDVPKLVTEDDTIDEPEPMTEDNSTDVPEPVTEADIAEPISNQQDTVQPGEDSNTVIWLVIGGIGAVVSVGCILLFIKRKR